MTPLPSRWHLRSAPEPRRRRLTMAAEKASAPLLGVPTAPTVTSDGARDNASAPAAAAAAAAAAADAGVAQRPLSPRRATYLQQQQLLPAARHNAASSLSGRLGASTKANRNERTAAKSNVSRMIKRSAFSLSLSHKQTTRQRRVAQ